MPESLSRYMAKLQHTGSLIQMFQTAASFGELSEALRKAILWCKGNKLKPAAYFLRNKLLKSNRLHHVEAQGCRYVARAGAFWIWHYILMLCFAAVQRNAVV